MNRSPAWGVSLLVLSLAACLFAGHGNASSFTIAAFEEADLADPAAAGTKYAVISPSGYYSTSSVVVEKNFEVTIYNLAAVDSDNIHLVMYPPRDSSEKLFYDIDKDSILPSDCSWRTGGIYTNSGAISCESQKKDLNGEYKVKFTAYTKEEPPNIARAENWEIKYFAGIFPLVGITDSMGLEVNSPKVKIAEPQDGSTVSGGINLVAEKSRGIPAYVRFFADSIELEPKQEGKDEKYTVFWDSSTVSDGAHTLKAFGCDIANNCESTGSSVQIQTDNGQLLPPANRPPAVKITAPGNGNIFETGEDIAFAATASDPESEAVEYKWDFGDGKTASALETTHSYSQAGTYTVVFTATDTRGAEGSDSIKIQAIAPFVPQEGNVAPTASIESPASGAVFEEKKWVSFKGKAFDPNPGDALGYFWEFGDGSTGQGSLVKYRYSTAGTYTVRLVVEDSHGAKGTDTIDLNIVKPPENLSPRISSISASPKAQQEGKPVEFKVVASDPDRDSLNYWWEFGDGKTAATAEAMHAYYLEPAEEKRAFTARVTVSDGLLSVSKTVTVTVNKAYFTIRFLKPASDPAVPLRKGEELEVQLRISDSSDQPLKGLSPKVSAEEEAIAVTETANGIYTGKFTSHYLYPVVMLIYAEASAAVSGMRRETSTANPVYLSPAEINISSPFAGKKYLLGSAIGELAVNLTYPDGSAVQDAVLYAESPCIEGKSDFLPVDGGFKASIGTAVNEEMYDCKLSLYARDAAGNEGSKTFIIPVDLENPLFRLVLEKPDLILNDLFTYSQPLSFVVDIQSPEKGNLKQVRVLLKAQAMNKEITLAKDESTGKYVASLRMPSAETGMDSLPIKVEATALLSREEIRAVKNIELKLTRSINVGFKYPVEGDTAFDPEKSKTIIVALTYPNGEAIDAEEVQAVLAYDGREEPVTLAKNMQTGLFEAQLGDGLQVGKYVLTIRLAEEEGGGEKSIVANIFQPFNWLLVVFLILGLFFVFSFVYFVRKTLKERAEKIERLKTEREDLLGLEKRLRFEYFKRHITEEEYKKRLLDTQQKLSTVEKKLKIKPEKREKKPELIPGFSERETRQIKDMVERLKPQTAKYGKEEVYLAIVQEGYPPRLAEEVTKQLFGQK